MAGGPPPAWIGFRHLRVVDIEPESTSVFSLRLAAPDGASLPSALPGQFVAVRLPAGRAGAPIVRSYSLSGRPGAAEYRISVKQEPFGAASGYLRSHIAGGDLLDVAAPRGTFTLRDGDGPVLLLSAGVGATPVLAMLHALAAQRSQREVWWLYGARNRGEHPFAREVRSLLAQLPHAHSLVCYSRPTPGDRQGIDYTDTGRLAAGVLGRLGVPHSVDAYLCGPPAFMREVPKWVEEHGIDPTRVHTEIFGTGPEITPGIAPHAALAPHPPAGPPGTGPAVTFSRSGLTVNWDPQYPSLLELAEACSVPVRWSCRTGVCHTCETGLLTGNVDYSPEPVEPPAEGDALVCCSQPDTDVVLDL